MEFDIDFDFKMDDNEEDNKTKQEEPKAKASHRLGKRHICRKASSEKVLEDILPFHFDENDCYHIISQGDVDSFSFCKHLVKAEKFDYLLLSTWCAAGEDFLEIQNWLRRGILKNVDFYVGEIFQKQYPDVFELAENMANEFGSRVCIFRNHSKVMVLSGKEKSAVIESSANVNTNPRTEQTVITFDKCLADFYIDFYEGITNFNKGLDKKWKK